MNEARIFTFELAQGDDGIGDLIRELRKIGTDLPNHHITSITYERAGHLVHRVSVTVDVERKDQAA